MDVRVPVVEQQSLLKDRWVERLPKNASVSTFTLNPPATMNECKSVAGRPLKDGYTSAIMDSMGYSVTLGEAVKQVGLDVYLAKGATIDALLCE